MLWDSSGESWVHFGIRVQPAAVLLDSQGHIIKVSKAGIDLPGMLKALPA